MAVSSVLRTLDFAEMDSTRLLTLIKSYLFNWAKLFEPQVNLGLHKPIWLDVLYKNGVSTQILYLLSLNSSFSLSIALSLHLRVDLGFLLLV